MSLQDDATSRLDLRSADWQLSDRARALELLVSLMSVTGAPSVAQEVLLGRHG